MGANTAKLEYLSQFPKIIFLILCPFNFLEATAHNVKSYNINLLPNMTLYRISHVSKGKNNAS